jgi:serine/threonine protein kinase
MGEGRSCLPAVPFGRSVTTDMWNPLQKNRVPQTLIDPSVASACEARQVFGPRQSLRSSVTGNHWEVVRSLGTGGMGTVYLVTDEEGREYALKTFNSKMLHTPSRWSMLEREATNWIMLDHHPNIVSALWCERIEDILCILLEYVPGGTVQLSLEKGPLPPAVALRYGLAICDAMAYAYQKLRLVHRDINPSNCLVDSTGRLKLTDFGIAWRPDPRSPSDLAGPGGTTGYKPPEQYDTTSPDARSDIYAFGASLFEMLTGVNVFNLPSTPANLLLFQHVGSNKRLRQISPELKNLLVHCLQPMAGDRPSSFTEVRAELSVIYQAVAKVHAPAPPAVNPLRIDELQNKGVALQILELYEPALSCYEQALKLSPGDYELWLGKSAACHLLRRHSEAINAADRGLVLEPTCGDLWNNRGMALLDTALFSEALASFSRAIDCNPTDSVYWRNKGLALYRMRRIAEAMGAYDHGLTCDDRDSRLYQYKAQALADEGRYNEARECLSAGINISSRHSGLHHGLGVIWHKLGKLAESLVALNCALEISPNDAGILHSKLSVLMDDGNWTEALAIVEELLTATSDDFYLLKARATLILRLGRIDEGIQALGNLWQRVHDNEELQAQLRDVAAQLDIPLQGFTGELYQLPRINKPPASA